ncbi:BnaC03g70250D [Brassica napus]|uniref:BnaC03g70250D protein n=1 Tax=Brassica napus TaxID=3708 RepID=A0A078FCC1_BRANA|nr:BnaC03g70250D [Brassica napus]
MVWCTSRGGERHIWHESFQVRNVVSEPEDQRVLGCGQCGRFTAESRSWTRTVSIWLRYVPNSCDERWCGRGRRDTKTIGKREKSKMLPPVLTT